MMIHVNSTTGTHISVNLPTVTPELIALAEKAPGKRLVLEVIDPVRSEVEQRFIDAARGTEFDLHVWALPASETMEALYTVSVNDSPACIQVPITLAIPFIREAMEERAATR